MAIENNTLTFFCANEQADTAHVLDIDGNGEVVLTCACGRFIKLPRTTTPESLKAYVEAHKAANEGQITVESIEAHKAELLAGLQEPEGAI